MSNVLTAEYLKSVVSYDPTTGVFTWRARRGPVVPGAVAGSLNQGGYWQIGLCYRVYKAHRLAFLYMTGSWPKHDVDHINGDTADNRWENLRDVSTSINLQNQRHAQRHNRSTGLLGASVNGKGYRAQISHAGRMRNLGTFSTPEEAHQAYLTAKRELHAGCTI